MQNALDKPIKEVIGKDFIRLWRTETKAQTLNTFINKAEGCNRILNVMDKVIGKQKKDSIERFRGFLNITQLEISRKELMDTFSNLQRIVQTVQSKPLLAKSEESKHNNHYLDQLGTHISSVEKLLAEISKRNADLHQNAAQPATRDKALRKLASAAKIHRILMAPLSLDRGLVRHFLKWRFRRVSATSKLLTDDINKCFAKFRKTMLILFNRRLLNKIAGHFHSFVQKCSVARYERTEEYVRFSLAQKGTKLYQIMVKSKVKSKGKNAKWAFNEWRIFVKKDIKKEYSRKRALILISGVVEKRVQRAAACFVEKLKYEMLNSLCTQMIPKSKVPFLYKGKLLCRAIKRVLERKKILYFQKIKAFTQLISKESRENVTKYRSVVKRSGARTEDYEEMVQDGIKKMAVSSIVRTVEKIMEAHTVGKSANIFSAFSKLKKTVRNKDLSILLRKGYLKELIRIKEYSLSRKYLLRWRKFMASLQKKPKKAVTKKHTNIEKMLIQNQANVIVTMEREMDKKSKEFEQKHRTKVLCPILLKKMWDNSRMCAEKFTVWRQSALCQAKRDELETKLKLLKDEHEYLKGKQKKKEEQEEDKNIQTRGGENDSMLLLQLGEDKLGMEYLAFIEHQNKDLEEKLASEMEEFKKNFETRESQLQALKEKLKQLTHQRNLLIKKKSESSRKIQLK